MLGQAPTIDPNTISSSHVRLLLFVAASIFQRRLPCSISFPVSHSRPSFMSRRRSSTSSPSDSYKHFYCVFTASTAATESIG